MPRLPEGSGEEQEMSGEGSAEVAVVTMAPQLVLTTVAPPRRELRNISAFPVCIADNDCQDDFKCFQYMCYPWNRCRECSHKHNAGM